MQFLLRPFGYLDDRSNEFQQEARELQEAGVKVVEEVHYEPLDV